MTTPAVNGPALKALREEAGLTKADLAALTAAHLPAEWLGRGGKGIAHQTIGYIESGEVANPRSRNLRAIVFALAAKLEIPVADAAERVGVDPSVVAELVPA